MGTKLILVRHAETDWNKESKYQGQKDVNLNATGKSQAEKLGKYLADKKIDVIYSSDLKRASETAGIVNKYHKLQIEKDQRLREISFGDWEGMTYGEIKEVYPDNFRKWFENPVLTAPPAGETLSEFEKRIINIFSEIIEASDGRSVSVFTHGGVIKVYLSYLLGVSVQNYWQFKVSSTGVSIVSIYGEKPIIESVNITEHLK